MPRKNELTDAQLRKRVISLDGNKCCNVKCLSLNKRNPKKLELHHTPKKSQGGTNKTKHGIILCQFCHNACHDGRKDGNGNHIPSYQVELEIFAELLARPNFRWEDGLLSALRAKWKKEGCNE